MNTKAKYTKGPWHIGTNPGPIIYGPQGEQVANMLPCMLEREERNANARLISSAPDLLAALEDTCRLLALLNAPGTNDPIEAAVFKARAAIAQALGE